MNLEHGDYVSGENISIGKFLGKNILGDREFYQIYDDFKQSTLYIPIGEEKKIRKIPSKKTILKYLKIFENNELIENQKIEGSRYLHYKEKLNNVSFKTELEVLHDLCIFHRKKKLTPPEKTLYEAIKSKLLIEISFVLDCDKIQASNMMSLKNEKR